MVDTDTDSESGSVFWISAKKHKVTLISWSAPR